MLTRVRPWSLVLAAVAGVSLGTLLGVLLQPGDQPRAMTSTGPPARSSEATPEPSRGHAEPAPLPPVQAERPSQERLRAALVQGVRAGEAHDGIVEAALMAPGWDAPIVVGDGGRRFRMWSLAKPVTALYIRLLYAREGSEPPGEVVDAMRRAIQRSENCAQRRAVLEAQRLSGDVESTARTLDAFLERFGVRAAANDDAQPAPEECRSFLESHAGAVEDPMGAALLLGTWRWSVADAVRFAAVLQDPRLGSAGAAVLRDMRRTKRPNEEAIPPLQVDPEFGAGKVLRDAAYKAGWGGQETGEYLVSQYGIDRRTGVAFAIAYHPDDQPLTADPGLTPADEAIQAVLRPVNRALSRP